MADKHLEVKCPGCGTIMTVDRISGKTIETRKPLLQKEEQTGDRFEDARKKVRARDQEVEDKVEAARKAQKDKLSKLDALFADRKKEIEESGEPIERPDSPFSND